MGFAVTATVSSVITKVLITEIVKKGITLSGSLLTSFNRKNNINQMVDRYFETVERIEKVRSLHQRDTDTDIHLDDIYIPLKIKSPEGCEYEVDNKFRIPYLRTTNIIGTAGQGKSTLLKRLFINEIVFNKSLAFFFELKDFKDENLNENLILQFQKWGLNFDSDTVEAFLSSKDVVLYLDGFDEVPPSFSERIEHQIITLDRCYNCKTIITSRPNTSICKLSGIDNYTVNKLTHDQVFTLLKKLYPGETALSIFDSLLDKPEMINVLETPILVVLLRISYAYSNTVPETLSDFYSNVFHTLYERHDSLKTSVKRELKSKLNCGVAESVFNAFCYSGIKSNHISFNKKEALSHIQYALNIREVEGVSASDFFDDIVRVTNIIQEDGFNNFTFFHRSIQEFFAYAFIDDYFSDAQKQEFYTYCLNDHKFCEQFELVIEFLLHKQNSIDVNKYFYIPAYEYLCSPSANGEFSSKIFDDIDLVFEYSDRHKINKINKDNKSKDKGEEYDKLIRLIESQNPNVARLELSSTLPRCSYTFEYPGAGIIAIGPQAEREIVNLIGIVTKNEVDIASKYGYSETGIYNFKLSDLVDEINDIGSIEKELIYDAQTSHAAELMIHNKKVQLKELKDKKLFSRSLP